MVSLVSQDAKAAKKKAAFDSALEEIEAKGDEGAPPDAGGDDDDEDFGRGKKGKKGKKAKEDAEDEEEEEGARGKKGKKGKVGKVAEESEPAEDFDFGKKGKGKKGKKGRGADDDWEDDVAAAVDPSPVIADAEDFDFGKKKGKGKDKKGGKSAASLPPSEPSGLDAAPKVVCTILDVRPHIDAKKLNVCTVDGGDEVGTVQVVCGGTNVRAGMVTALAPIGSAVATPSGAPLTIKAMTLRGEKSEGMLCGLGELGKMPGGWLIA